MAHPVTGHHLHRLRDRGGARHRVQHAGHELAGGHVQGLGAGPGEAAHDVALTEDADELAGGVEHQHRADPPLGEQGATSGIVAVGATWPISVPLCLRIAAIVMLASCRRITAE